MQFKGIDSKVADGIIKSVSKDIDSATIKLKSFDAQFEETIKNGRRLQSIKFVGIDEDGKTLNILSKIDKKTGEVASTVTHVTQKFDAFRSIAQDDIELKITTKAVDADISNVTRRINELKTFNSSDIIDLGLDDDLANLQKIRSSMDNLSGAQLVNAYGDLSESNFISRR